MKIIIISLFPEMFKIITDYGILKRAIKNNLLNIQYLNPREFTKNSIIDDRPYGGGPGMLMMADPLKKAIKEAKNIIGTDTKVIYLSPQGRKLNHTEIIHLSNNNKIIILCGRYEGIDERLLELEINEEWSIGDYILSGGELAAMVLIDAISRLIPGVLNSSESLLEESFTNGLLDYPHYTRPKFLYGMKSVPLVLLSGNHNKIRRWRLKQSLGRTWIKRPELLKKIKLNKEQLILLQEFKCEKLNM